MFPQLKVLPKIYSLGKESKKISIDINSSHYQQLFNMLKVTSGLRMRVCGTVPLPLLVNNYRRSCRSCRSRATSEPLANRFLAPVLTEEAVPLYCLLLPPGWKLLCYILVLVCRFTTLRWIWIILENIDAFWKGFNTIIHHFTYFHPKIGCELKIV